LEQYGIITPHVRFLLWCGLTVRNCDDNLAEGHRWSRQATRDRLRGASGGRQHVSGRAADTLCRRASRRYSQTGALRPSASSIVVAGPHSTKVQSARLTAHSSLLTGAVDMAGVVLIAIDSSQQAETAFECEYMSASYRCCYDMTKYIYLGGAVCR